MNINNLNTLSLKRNIMMRIYLIFFIRKLKSPFAFKVSLLVLSLFSINLAVSLQNVIANTPGNPVGLYYFGTNAFLNTQLAVKMMTLTVLGATLFLLKDIPVYLLRTLPRPKLLWRT